MCQKQGKFFLIVSTVCVSLVILSNLINDLTTGDWGSPVSNVCFTVSAVCLIIAWVDYFRKKKS